LERIEPSIFAKIIHNA